MQRLSLSSVIAIVVTACVPLLVFVGHHIRQANRTLLLHKLTPRSSDPALQSTPSISLGKGPKFIIILSVFRSGSTFLGELFNTNPDVLYDYESLHPYGLYHRDDEVGPGASSSEESDESPSGVENANVKLVKPHHTLTDVHLLYLQQLLMSCDFVLNSFEHYMHRHWRCGRTLEVNMKLFGTAECDDRQRNVTNIRKARRWHCYNRNANALKLIRLRRLTDLRRIGKLDMANVHIIHLRRDPRAIARSRADFGEMLYHGLTRAHGDTNPKLGLESYDTCRGYVSDITCGEKCSWLKGRYLPIDHTDLASNLRETAQRIYRFVGLQLEGETARWVENQGTPLDSDTQGLVALAEMVFRQQYERWPSSIRLDQLHVVEEECGELLRRLSREQPSPDFQQFTLDEDRHYLPYRPMRH